MSVTYTMTADPNVFIETRTYNTTVKLDEVDASIVGAQAMIDSLPSPKVTPDEETLALWNMEHEVAALCRKSAKVVISGD